MIARRTKARTRRSDPERTARVKRAKSREERDKAKHPHAFLPELLDQVRAIAMQGVSDDEMAAMFGISPGQIEAWKEFYPSFAQAINDGRTRADAEIVVALYKRAIGYSHPEERIFYDAQDGAIVRADTVRHYPPDLPSIKLWLTNRKREQWKDRTHTSVGGSKDAGDDAPIGVRNETKLELMSSILSLIKPKSDTPATEKRK